MVNGQWSVVSGQWSVVSGQWSVVSGQWSVVSGQWSVVSGQWRTIPEVKAGSFLDISRWLSEAILAERAHRNRTQTHKPQMGFWTGRDRCLRSRTRLGFVELIGHPVVSLADAMLNAPANIRNALPAFIATDD